MSESKYAEDLALAHLLADIADSISTACSLPTAKLPSRWAFRPTTS